jgi:thymidylate kinase
MAFLIIIRGPPGSGKTEIGNCLRNRLNLSHTLQLDETRPDIFEDNISTVLGHEYVVGEMHYGNDHTTEPSRWLDRFTARDFKIISVVLQVRFETCVKRAVSRAKDPFSPLEAINQYFLFYAKYMQIFRSKTRVQEIYIDCENKSPEQIADDIFYLATTGEREDIHR